MPAFEVTVQQMIKIGQRSNPEPVERIFKVTAPSLKSAISSVKNLNLGRGAQVIGVEKLVSKERLPSKGMRRKRGL